MKKTKYCRHCVEKFTPSHRLQVYCGKACEYAHQNEAAKKKRHLPITGPVPVQTKSLAQVLEEWKKDVGLT